MCVYTCLHACVCAYVCVAHAECKCVCRKAEHAPSLYHGRPYSRTPAELGVRLAANAPSGFITFNARATDRCEWLYSSSHRDARDLNVDPHAAIGWLISSGISPAPKLLEAP